MNGYTIKDIAKICGVSISTVSRAINDDPAISPKTRERVLAAVKELKYVPNNSARNLKMNDSNTVGLVLKGINNPFFQGMLPYFQQELEKHGYQFLFHSVQSNADEVLAAEEVAKEKRLRGIIFLGGIMDYPEVALENIQLPMVLCSVAVPSQEPSEEVRVSSVSIDDAAEAFRAVNYLCSRGHRRIAIITGQQSDYTVGMLRLQGYRKALHDNGIAVDPELIGYMDPEIPEYTEANGYRVMKRLLEKNKDLTAVFVIADRMALGAYKAIYEAGLRIPDDISVIGFDGIEAAKYMVPELTTMSQPVEKMVRSSVRMMMEQLEGSGKKEHVIYRAALLERESVRSIPDTAGGTLKGIRAV